VDNARFAESRGVDALGFVFVEKSKRVVSLEQAIAINRELGPFVSRVGLFLDASADFVRTVLRAMPGLIPQFHGSESAEFCDAFDRQYIKAIGLGDGVPDEAVIRSYRGASGLMFDSNAVGELGGTGHTFDWSLLDRVSTQSLILAGGLNPGNVQTAIATVNPYAVDVSTGVEAGPGLKDESKVAQFIDNVRSAGR